MTLRFPVMGIRGTVGIWARFIRPGFIVVGTGCVPLGAVIAWYETGTFSPWYLLITWVGAFLLFGALNVFNDYFDYSLDSDMPPESLTPFSGGSRFIQKGLVPLREALRGGILLLVPVLAIGLILALTRNLLILPLGLWGIFCSAFYTAPPVSIGSRGLGELVAGLNCGPLVALGSYLVQTGAFSWIPLLIALPPGLLVGTILWINQIPDAEVDGRHGKRTWAVRIGKEKAARLYPVLLTLMYLTVLTEVATGILPFAALLVLISIPLAFKAARIVTRSYNDIPKLIPGLASHILLTIFVIVLLAAGLLIP
jgi:1,4-dihydroxy-2-naphthoate polyprenyltransferase